ncbi:hypothetical protein [Spirosoma telluris]|uniref:hypothetical protein n=1 Tax=Spirosoma telluris TaxID=2183553 RepID=UPI002FC3BEC6
MLRYTLKHPPLASSQYRDLLNSDQLRYGPAQGFIIDLLVFDKGNFTLCFQFKTVPMGIIMNGVHARWGSIVRILRKKRASCSNEAS